MSETVNAPAITAQGAFTASVDGRPTLFTVQGQTAQPALTLNPADFGLGEHDAVAEAYLAPDGRQAAYVVSDNSQQGAIVRLLNLADRQSAELIRHTGDDRLTNFAWKPDSSQLAFMRTAPAEDPTQPYISQVWAVPAAGGPPTKLYGDDVLQFLGWAADGQSLHLTRRLKGLFAYSILDLASGQTRDVLLPSNFEQSQDLDIIGLTFEMNTQEGRLAYVLNSSPYLQNCNATPLLVVDAGNGSVLRQFRTDGAAADLTFSPDLNFLAFTLYKFAVGTTGADSGKPDVNISDATSGVSVLNLNDGTTSQIITPQSGVGQYNILAWAGDNSGLFVTGDDGAVQFVDFQGNASPLVPPQVQAQAEPTVGGAAGVQALGIANAVVNLDVPYIHQIKMTPNDFDGNWACGPTSATMVAAYYGKLPARNDTFMGNRSQYGWYISNVFNSPATGFTFNRYEKDASGSPHAGAYGHCVQDGLGYAWRIADYLTKLGLAAKFQSSVSFSAIKPYLDAGKPIVLSTNIHGFGHIVCLKGYTSDGRWIVNDPYWTQPGSGQIAYTLAQLQSVPWMITIDTAPPGQQSTTPPATPTTPTQPSSPQPGAGNDGLAPRFRDAYNRLGGSGAIGAAKGNVYSYNNRFIQEFQGGAKVSGILLADTRNDRPDDKPVATAQPAFGVFGAFFKAWRETYGGSGGQLGSPQSDEFVNGQGNRQQNFENGYILMQGQSDNPQGAFPWPTQFNGWQAQYYNNSGLAGQPAYIRDEAPVASGGFAHNWGAGAPDNGQIGILKDTFSVRFTRHIDFGDGGVYAFVATVDDGFRLIIDGQNLAGDPNQFWQVSAATAHTFRLAVGPGVHTVVLEYLEVGGNAVVQLDINKEPPQ